MDHDRKNYTSQSRASTNHPSGDHAQAHPVLMPYPLAIMNALDDYRTAAHQPNMAALRSSLAQTSTSSAPALPGKTANREFVAPAPLAHEQLAAQRGLNPDAKSFVPAASIKSDAGMLNPRAEVYESGRPWWLEREAARARAGDVAREYANDVMRSPGRGPAVRVPGGSGEGRSEGRVDRSGDKCG